ncbi:MAG TPA: prenyltransferase/squalene oxidase repeat-containing protein [Lacipirellulaceae bacterium]|nr:prenyltransferase/squalene oxidase repeat-containing protein [Lacipirellulaceae bacterium]
MTSPPPRPLTHGRRSLGGCVGAAALAVVAAIALPRVPAGAAIVDPELRKTIIGGLDWLAFTQHRQGHWNAQGRYPVAMTALAGLAMLAEGSTTTEGKYAENIRRAVDYLTRRVRPNGLIGDVEDDRYTYGHGFAMLFLSEVLGEEEDQPRRDELVDLLTRAVVFTGQAQTPAGGWGYVSWQDLREGGLADEGSTTITQVQGLRGCRNAGIPVPREVIEKAVKYIHNCTMDDGAVQYSSQGGGGRPAITAAAIACLYNAGEYDDQYVPRMQKYCAAQLDPAARDAFGHWHYAHFYYSQVRYREGGDAWNAYRSAIESRILREATEVSVGQGKGYVWQQGYVGPVYTTSLNLIILQLENAYLPIYQR